MAAPAGNQNAKGNSGGFGLPKAYREKQVELKKLMVEEMLKIMRGKDKNKKLQVIMKHGSRALPAEIEGVGDGGEFIIKIIDYGNGSGNPAQLRPGEAPLPAEGATEPGAV